MFVVAAVPVDFEMIADQFLPGAPVVARSVDRVYRMCRSKTPIEVEHRDTIDGSLLISLQSFETVEQAKAWIERDAAQCRLLRAVVGRAS